MKQMSLGESGFERKTKRTRKREFQDEGSLVVPWAELLLLITPHAPTPSAKGGRPFVARTAITDQNKRAEEKPRSWTPRVLTE